MDAFKTHEQVISHYRNYLSSFIHIADDRIKNEVTNAFNSAGFIPEPLIQFNPSFQKGESLELLSENGEVHPDLVKTIGNYNLYRHQVQAIRIGMSGKGFIVTSGTGSGKSLTYLATIFNSIFRQGLLKRKGVKAILVYPMNALINSQEEEIIKFQKQFGENFPVTFAKYTGQEGTEHREKVRKEEPDIILTNYMMLELIMTRQSEAWLRESIKSNLQYLVFDELHTYRGRQGADVSLLIRRINGWCKSEFFCIGTSATMASVGTPEEKKRTVAKVATTIFGKEFNVNQIVDEYLETCTTGQQANPPVLRKCIEAGIDINADEKSFIEHPLTNWLEINIALKKNEGTLEREKPRTLTDIAELLAKTTEKDIKSVKSVLIDLLHWTEKLNEENQIKNTRKSYLPFRFHQFISQTSTVSVTLEARENRSISVQPGRYIKQNNEEKLLFPVLFSRFSGIDFICVKKDVANKTLLPRNPSDTIETLTLSEAKGANLKEENYAEGYLILDEGELYWNDDPKEIAPIEWLTKDTSRFRPEYEWLMPKPVFFNSKGEYSSDEIYPLKGYYIPAKLRIDPTAGVIYEDPKIKENTKLTGLGNGGRSTATTIMSYSVVDSLFNQKELRENQKLLSFTDNRQDASLQAGHFNDFLSTVRLRAAISVALKNNPVGLDVNTIAERVFEVLKLEETAYAKDPSTNPRFADEDNVKALKIYILYRIFQDLKKGWRYTLPNLEQTALMRIEYKNLKKLCSYDDEFKDIPYFNELSAEKREDILTQLLHFFRTNFSLYHRIIVEDKAETENILKNKLDEKKLWSLDPNETLDAPTYMVTVVPGRSTQKRIYFASMGLRSGIGKFIKRTLLEEGFPALKKDEYGEMIEMLCDKLANDAKILQKRTGLRGSNTIVDGYLLKSDFIIWLPGDEETVETDKTRLNTYKDVKILPNRYFQNLYKTDFSKYTKEIIGREHTGQLSSSDRIEREGAFRSGDISTLFCSPTMELGIDISNLNIVHMRNVPPNPANYAQRSGRAGRSGQTAVVFTYCSAMSPHDQNYFKAAHTMVAGTVVAPRIDLKNEELLTSHFNAFILMELAIRELNSSVADMLDLTNEANIRVREDIINSLHNGLLHYKQRWIADFRKVAETIIPELNSTWWFTNDWFDKKINSFVSRFQKAFDRWIKLYLSALNMMNKSHIILKDPTLKSDNPIRTEAKIQYSISQKQIALLKNDSNSSNNNESEFYIFRYLASEGFLPGYNFTRLPIRTFVGYHYTGQGEYISRPRAIALKEFGPQNILYHNGSKYRINRMLVIDSESAQRKIKLSLETGYAFLDMDAEMANIDPITRKELKNGVNSEYKTTLIEMAESEGVPQERISCVEEERMSSGYRIEEYFRYPQGIEHTGKLIIKKGDENLLNLIYGQATELIKINRKLNRADHEGFSIDKRNGKWLAQKDLEQEEIQANSKDVMIFVRDTADTLYIQPLQALGLNKIQTVSFSYAIKRGLEKLFQTEENEIGVRVIGNDETPNILLFESAEGSLGILSQLVQEPAKLKELFVESYKSMHYNPESREETELGKSLPKASYQDLLSYYNQREHDILDRRSIKKTLEFLMDCDFSTVQNGNDRYAQYQYLLENYDKNSGTEKKLIDYLYDNNLALPDKTQVNMPDFYISVDFVYNTENGPVLIFCDGSVHDNPDLKEADKHKRQLLREDGYDVIEWHYLERTEELVLRRKDIFRKVK